MRLSTSCAWVIGAVIQARIITILERGIKQRKIGQQQPIAGIGFRVEVFHVVRLEVAYMDNTILIRGIIFTLYTHIEGIAAGLNAAIREDTPSCYLHVDVALKDDTVGCAPVT